MRLFTTFAAGALAVAQLTAGLTITVDDEDSVKQAASTIAYDMAKYYKGNESGYVPGLLGDPYYWWECGGKNKLRRVANGTMLIAGLQQRCSILTSTIGTTLATRSTMPW